MEIDVINREGVIKEISVEMFLETFFDTSLKYVPDRGIVQIEDMDNLEDLFFDLWVKSPLTSFRYFLFFHLSNHKKLIKIFWEFLYV